MTCLRVLPRLPICAILAIVSINSCIAAAEELGMGLIFSPGEDVEKIPLAASLFSGAAVLPARVDLSVSFPPPGNQGRQNSCTGWATAYALKSYQERVELGWDVTRSSAQFSPSYVYDQINNGRDGGACLEDALRVLEDGCATLDAFPYQSNVLAKPDADTKSKARPYKIAVWRRINPAAANEVKAHLEAGFPVIIGADVTEEFQRLGKGQVYENREHSKSKGGHAMCVVGYDDDRSAYKVINSWGKEWGDGGFGWISYQAFSAMTKVAYIASDAENEVSETRQTRHVGDWVSLTSSDSEKHNTRKVTRAIIKRTTKDVTLKTIIEDEGVARPVVSYTTIPIQDWQEMISAQANAVGVPSLEGVRAGTGPITIGSRTIQATWIEVSTTKQGQESSVKIWRTNEVPLEPNVLWETKIGAKTCVQKVTDFGFRNFRDPYPNLTPEVTIGERKTWAASLRAAIQKHLDENGKSMAKEIQGITHPSGKTPTLDAVQLSEAQGTQGPVGIIVRISVRWSGGLSGASYVTTIKWDVSDIWADANVEKDTALISISKEQTKRLKEYFDQLYRSKFRGIAVEANP